MVFHAIMKIGAFFCAGAVLHQSHKEYVDELNGIGYRMPVVFVCFTICGLSLIGVPGFAGFISKWNIAQAAMQTGQDFPYAYAAVGILLYSALMTAIYILTVAVRAWFPDKGTDVESLEKIKDPNWEMKLPLILFAGAILVFGLGSESVVRILRLVAEGVF